MGELEDVLTVATLVVDRYADPEAYVAQRIAWAEAARDPRTRGKWLRVREAMRAMLSERRASADELRAESAR